MQQLYNLADMTRTFDLNADYDDVFLGLDGTVAVAEGGKAVLINVIELLRTSQGEWNQDVTLGLPFAAELRSGAIDSAVAAGVIESLVLSVNGVRNVEIQRVDTDDQRNLFVDLLLTTEEGEVIPIPDLALHPSSTGTGPGVPENVLGWRGEPLQWLGNYLTWGI